LHAGLGQLPGVMTGAEHSIAGPAGVLQLVEQQPEHDVRAVAVVCHPHPQRGGSMKNKVVHQLARSFRELGAVSVRFNFRGVGASEGTYGRGDGELEDLGAVVSWARERWPGRPLWLAGFSFGAAVVLRGAQRFAADWLVTAAPPIRYLPADALPAAGVPWLLIQGAADDVVPAAQVLEWVEALPQTPQLTLLEGAGHFFHGRLNELKQTVLDAAGAQGAVSVAARASDA
jgi:alpha/beta superfamily hydrolase